MYLCLGSVSSLEHFHYVSVSSRLDQIRNVLDRLMSRYFCLVQCLCLEKNVSTLSLVIPIYDVYRYILHVIRFTPTVGVYFDTNPRGGQRSLYVWNLRHSFAHGGYNIMKESQNFKIAHVIIPFSEQDAHLHTKLHRNRPICSWDIHVEIKHLNVFISISQLHIPERHIFAWFRNFWDTKCQHILKRLTSTRALKNEKK